jgi:hypothetical protein
MPVTSADDLYELAKQLPTSERLRLVERIAHELTLDRDNMAPSTGKPPVAGTKTRTQLIGQVTDIALEPPQFKVRTTRGGVSVSAGAHLIDAVWDAWGREVIVDVEASLDVDGAPFDATAIAIEVVAQADDLLANFESTFGSGSEIWGSREVHPRLLVLRGGGV